MEHNKKIGEKQLQTCMDLTETFDFIQKETIWR